MRSPRCRTVRDVLSDRRRRPRDVEHLVGHAAGWHHDFTDDRSALGDGERRGHVHVHRHRRNRRRMHRFGVDHADRADRTESGPVVHRGCESNGPRRRVGAKRRRMGDRHQPGPAERSGSIGGVQRDGQFESVAVQCGPGRLANRDAHVSHLRRMRPGSRRSRWSCRTAAARRAAVSIRRLRKPSPSPSRPSTTPRASPSARIRPCSRTRRADGDRGRPRSARARPTKRARRSPSTSPATPTPALFSAGPAVSSTGTLTYTTAANTPARRRSR